MATSFVCPVVESWQLKLPGITVNWVPTQAPIHMRNSPEFSPARNQVVFRISFLGLRDIQYLSPGPLSKLSHKEWNLLPFVSQSKTFEFNKKDNDSAHYRKVRTTVNTLTKDAFPPRTQPALSTLDLH